jgi:transmembrane sensor
MSREKFISLLEKYVADTILPEERSDFFLAVSSGAFDDLLTQHLDGQLNTHSAKGADLPAQRSAQMLHKILSSEKQNAALIPVVSLRARIIRWSVAAAVLAMLIIGGYLLNDQQSGKSTSTLAFAEGMQEKNNSTGKPLKVLLEDGSIVTLASGSSIHYPDHFLPGKREVFLEGEAFFEVSKNAKRPFFVYNNNIVTHVLGTSFTVKSNQHTGQVEVSVRSGRVEVYEKGDAEKNVVANNNGVILLPNQKVLYNEKAKQFVPSLVDSPLPLITEGPEKELKIENTTFEETPLKAVLPSLEKSYGVEIVVENEEIYKCLFTGDISQQDLFTRLEIVCQATGATYEVKGTKVLIKGKGCGAAN